MLKIKKLCVSYGNKIILDNLNLELKKNEILGIVGESGAGKSTLLLSIMGLCSARLTGEIIFGDKNLINLNNEEMNQIRWNEISIVFQSLANALNPILNIMEQVTEPMLEHNFCLPQEALERGKELLKMVGLKEDKFALYPHQLSGGERQKVLIAMALSNNPHILLLDEPTSALDPLTKKEILLLLRKIARKRSIIFVTHDLAAASFLTDRLGVLYKGRIMELGASSKILSDPKHPYTRGLLRCFPNMTMTKDLQGIKKGEEVGTVGCPFYSRCTQSIESCSSSKPNLEYRGDRFIACHRGGIVDLLVIKNLDKFYDKTKVLNNINLKIKEGETLALVGQSGSGKTTLAKCIIGLESFSRGKIIFSGQEIKKRNKNFYKNVQIIYQDPRECISHRLNVYQAVEEPLLIHNIKDRKVRHSKVLQALKDVQLPIMDSFLNEYPHHLSGGEIQRLAIARALVLEPKLIIADEPTSALDASVQANICKLLLSLQELRGLTLLFITHDIALARKISDRIGVMLAGEIVEEGLTSEIIAQPQHFFTKELIAAAPALLLNDRKLKVFREAL